MQIMMPLLHFYCYQVPHEMALHWSFISNLFHFVFVFLGFKYFNREYKNVFFFLQITTTHTFFGDSEQEKFI